MLCIIIPYRYAKIGRQIRDLTPHQIQFHNILTPTSYKSTPYKTEKKGNVVRQARIRIYVTKQHPMFMHATIYLHIVVSSVSAHVEVI